MKPIFLTVPAALFATAAAAHDSAHMHHHLSDPNWLPLTAGLVMMGLAALLAWSRK